jgi:NYN domain
MPVRTAIFIDFDNFHGNLEKVDPRAAERFADDPASWLEWFRLGGHAVAPGAGHAVDREGSPTKCQPVEPRRILLRRCYLNPDKFRRHRAGFVRAGFTVHDCPPLTTRGKNAADLWMTVDILDAIAHPTAFEEFIILASDADFTPVLLRLREHDRRTTLVNDKLMAGALRAACDMVVPQDRFMAEALGVPAEVPAGTVTEPPAPGPALVGAALRAEAPPPRLRSHAGGMRADRLARALAGEPPELIELATRLHAAIGLPALSPAQYRGAFEAMAAAISESGEFDLIGRTVDRCRAAGVEIVNRPISDIREMLRGAGFDFASGPVTTVDVTTAFHACVLALCRQEEVALSAPEHVLLDDWLGLVNRDQTATSLA